MTNIHKHCKLKALVRDFQLILSIFVLINKSELEYESHFIFFMWFKSFNPMRPTASSVCDCTFLLGRQAESTGGVFRLLFSLLFSLLPEMGVAKYQPLEMD